MSKKLSLDTSKPRRRYTARREMTMAEEKRRINAALKRKGLLKEKWE